jgi:hypothetical protein
MEVGVWNLLWLDLPIRFLQSGRGPGVTLHAGPLAFLNGEITFIWYGRPRLERNAKGFQLYKVGSSKDNNFRLNKNGEKTVSNSFFLS